MAPTVTIEPETSDGRLECILCISGKRKSGKDFVTRHLAQLLARTFPSLTVSICTLSEPLKEEFAQMHGLDVAELMGDGQAKELVRGEMIAFGEDLRARDYGIFCRKAWPRRKRQSQAEAHGNGHNSAGGGELVLVSDCRRPTDFQYFRERFPSTPILFIRVDSSLERRKEREFVFKSGVDDAESECGLDSFAGWHFRLCNDDDGEEELERKLGPIVDHLMRMMKGREDLP